MIAMRHSVAGGDSVKFIQALASDGVACVVCPHVHENVDDAKVRIVLRKPVNMSVLGGKNLFGYSKNDSRWCLNNYNAGSPVKFELYSGSEYVYSALWPSFPEGFFEIVAERSGDTARLLVEGVEAFSRTVTGTPVTGRFGVYTQNDIDGDAVNPLSGRTPAGVPVSAFDEWDGGDLVTSLRPCVDKSGEVCFYDLVSRSYVRSVTGGSFYEVSETSSPSGT